MGQSMSLCGSRNRLGRSLSLSFNDQPGQPDALPPFYPPSLGMKEERKDDDEFGPSESPYYDNAITEQQRVVERNDDSDDEEDAAVHREYAHNKLRRDKTFAHLSAFSSSSSLHSSPGSGSDHAYYTTDEESPLSSASSSSSLSVQTSPPRALTASTLRSSSHAITVSQPTSAHQSLVNSHPLTQHRIDVTPSLPHSQLHTQHHRALTTSVSDLLPPPRLLLGGAE